MRLGNDCIENIQVDRIGETLVIPRLTVVGFHLPPGGILITSGDNDTYPLWYLQEEKNLRRDVLVINKSLLGLRRYIGMLDKKYQGRLFMTKESVYYKNNFDYFLYQESKEYVHPEEAGSFIYGLDNYDYKNDTDRVMYKGEQVKKYQAKEIYFNLMPASDSPVASVIKTIELKNDYLMIDDFMLFDIINTNMDRRKICFTYSDPLFENVLDKGKNIYTLKFEK
jgi:hypothetical protein